MIPNAISSVTASHIKDLVADGISESRELDYKKELPTGCCPVQARRAFPRARVAPVRFDR